jgi:hypothetical protein
VPSGPPAPEAVTDLVTGTAVMLTTSADGPGEWLRAGQALQRILLAAGLAEDLSAAFHTQPLEVPELREFIRTRFYRGEHPQVLLRLGTAIADTFETVRRPVGEVIHEDF